MNWRLRLRDLWQRIRKRLGFDPSLCKNCVFNNPRDCRHRTRPNATFCEDYKKK